MLPSGVCAQNPFRAEHFEFPWACGPPIGMKARSSGSLIPNRLRRDFRRSAIGIYRQPHGSKGTIRRMDAVLDAREAKEFLISKIVAEAQRENAPLSETERKMLYFTESGWTLPDITQVNEQFDREYNQDEYEKKIARIIGRAYKIGRAHV